MQQLVRCLPTAKHKREITQADTKRFSFSIMQRCWDKCHLSSWNSKENFHLFVTRCIFFLLFLPHKTMLKRIFNAFPLNTRPQWWTRLVQQVFTLTAIAISVRVVNKIDCVGIQLTPKQFAVCIFTHVSIICTNYCNVSDHFKSKQNC